MADETDSESTGNFNNKDMSQLMTDVAVIKADIRGLGERFSQFIGLMEKMENGLKEEVRDHESRLRKLEERSTDSGARTRVSDGLMRFLVAPLITAGMIGLLGLLFTTTRPPQAAPQIIYAAPPLPAPVQTRK